MNTTAPARPAQDDTQGLDMGTRLSRFECAQETIVHRMALRTDWIWREKEKAAPDAALLAEWDAERDRLQDELDALRFDDVAAFAHIQRDYSPELLADQKANQQKYMAEAAALQAQHTARPSTHEAAQ